MGRIFPEFEDFLVKYGSFHDNLTNKLIHIVFVPLGFFSFCCLLCSVILYGEKDYGTENPPFQELNLTNVIHCFCTILFLNVDFVSGCVSTAVYTSMVVVARNWYLAAFSNGTLGEFNIFWGIVLAICIFSQFAGHGIFEKRAPALMSDPFNFFYRARLCYS